MLARAKCTVYWPGIDKDITNFIGSVIHAPDMSYDTLILALKTIFMPTILITENGRQYCSEEFKQFSLDWSFVHKTSSPYYPKGNSYAERTTGVVKQVFSKCKDDFLLGLLVHRSTPLLW